LNFFGPKRCSRAFEGNSIRSNYSSVDQTIEQTSAMAYTIDVMVGNAASCRRRMRFSGCCATSSIEGSSSAGCRILRRLHVHLDGTPVRSCRTPVSSVAAPAVRLSKGLRPIRRPEAATAWMSSTCRNAAIARRPAHVATALLTKTPHPSDQEIDAAMRAMSAAAVPIRASVPPSTKSPYSCDRSGGEVIMKIMTAKRRDAHPSSSSSPAFSRRLLLKASAAPAAGCCCTRFCPRGARRDGGFIGRSSR